MICLKVKQAQLKENKMSNNIYKILDKLKSVAGLDTPATPTKAKETIYESVAPRGDIAEAINSLESKYNTFKESTEGKQFKDISIGGKFVNGGVACVKTGEDTAKVSDSGRVIYLKPTSKIEEGREHKDKDSFDTNGKVGDTYKTTKGTVTKTTNGVRHERSAGKEEKDSDYIDAMDRTDEGIMSSIKSALGGKKKPVARTRSTPKPDFRTSPEPQGSRRRESEYGANNWLAGSVNEESGGDSSQYFIVFDDDGFNDKVKGPFSSEKEADDALVFLQRKNPQDHYKVVPLSQLAEESGEAGWKVWEVSILNNYYNGKYADYTSRVYPVVASSADESKQVVLQNAEAILQDLLTKKSQNGKKILPRGSALPITEKLIVNVEDGTLRYKRTTSMPKPFFTPDGQKMLTLNMGNIENEAELAEESDDGMDIVPEMWYVVTSQGIETGPYKSRAEAKQNCPDMSHSAMIGAEAIEVFADDDMNEAGELDNYFPNAMSDLAKLSGVKYDKKPEPPDGFSNDDEVLDHDLRADPSKPAYIKKVTELSKDTMRSYVDKGRKSNNAYLAKDEKSDKDVDTFYKRAKGLSTASSKIANEAFDTPADRDENAIANRKRLQALRDKQEDERAERGNDDYNTPMTRKVAGRAYGGTAQQDDSEFTSTGDDKLKKGFVNQQDNSLGVKWKKTGMGGAIDPELDEATATNQTYTVVTRKARDGRERESTGTLAELLDNFGYTLEVGKSYEHERGNRKINMNPKNIEALVNNLNNAKSNAAANGAPDVYYSVGENKTAEPSAIAEDDNDGISIQAAALCPNHTILTAWGKQTVVGLDRMMSRVKTEDGYDEKLHNEIVDAIMNGESLVKTDWGTKNRNGISDMIYRHNGFATYETDGEDSGLDEGVEFSDKIKNSQSKWKKEPMKLKESKMLNESLEDVLKRFPHEVKAFETGGDMDEDLYHALFDYYFTNGQMPYGIAKARSGDPMEWVCQELESELGLGESIVDVNQSNIPSPTNDMPVTQELDEISALAGLARPATTAVATNVASNLMDETTDTSEVDSILSKVGTGELDAYDVMNNPKNPIEQSAANEIARMYDEVASSYRLHPDDDFEHIYDIVADRLASDYQVFNSPSKELDEIAALAGLARPVATAVATTVASNMLADDDSGADDLSGLSDAELIRMANQDGIEDMIVTDGEGGLVNRDEIINQLDSSFMGTNANPIEEEESEFFKNPLGTNNITLEEEGVEEADPRKRDIEYTNTPREKTAGVQAAIPSGTDQSRIKKQYRKEYPGDNHMAVKEDTLWKSYQAMLNDVTTKK